MGQLEQLTKFCNNGSRRFVAPKISRWK